MLGPKISYIELCDEATVKANEEWGNNKFPLRPSSAGKCTRELGYELMEYLGYAKYEHEPKEPNVIRLLSLGHTVEYSILNEFKKIEGMELKYGQQCLSFFRLPHTKQLIEGNIDKTFFYSLEGEEYKCLIDIKSKKDKWSNHYATKWDEDNTWLEQLKCVKKFGESAYYIDDLAEFLTILDTKDPFWAANFHQLNMYFFDEHEFLRERGIDHAALIYYMKNESLLREIRFRPSEAIYQKLKEKFIAVDSAIVKHKNPSLLRQDFLFGSVKCAFCDYNVECWEKSREESRKAFFATLPRKYWPKDTNRMQGELGTLMEEAYAQYKQLLGSTEQLEKVELDIIKMMEDNKIYKVRFSDGMIYETKLLKTGVVLRRGKL